MFGERGRAGLQVVGEAQSDRQLHELLAQQLETVAPHLSQRLAGRVRRDERMTVAVTAHPVAEAKLRQVAGAQDRRIELDRRPRLPQSTIQLR